MSMASFSQGDRPQRATQNTVQLEATHLFLFYFESDNSFDYYPAHSGIWPAEYSDNKKKISLKKYDKVFLKEKGFGMFIKHGSHKKK